MIDIDIKLNPFGSEIGVVSIGNIKIANVGRDGITGRYKYVYLIHDTESEFCAEQIIHGVVYGCRRDAPVSWLLRTLLDDYGEGECELSRKYAEHWMGE